MDYPLKTFPPDAPLAFNEDQWVKQLFLISDMASWLGEAEQSLFYQLPLKNKKQLLRRSYYLSAQAVAHILEKHFYKIQRYPLAGKFTLPVAEIFSRLRCASAGRPTNASPCPAPATCNA